MDKLLQYRIIRILNDSAVQIQLRCKDEEKALAVYGEIIQLMADIKEL